MLAQDFIQLNWEGDQVDHLILGYVYLESNRIKRKTFTWDSSVALLSPTCFANFFAKFFFMIRGL